MQIDQNKMSVSFPVWLTASADLRKPRVQKGELVSYLLVIVCHRLRGTTTRVSYSDNNLVQCPAKHRIYENSKAAAELCYP